MDHIKRKIIFLKKFFRINAILHLGLSYGLGFTMILVFIRAYLNGGLIIVNINYYGEMFFELSLIFVYLITFVIKTLEDGFKYKEKLR